MNCNSHLATLADASSLLLGIDRKLTKIQKEPESLPAQSPVPGTLLHGMGEVTRARRNVVWSDGGISEADKRFYSEFYPVAAPCDSRLTEEVLGTSARLLDRPSIVRRSP
jgi:hypothetical protein